MGSLSQLMIRILRTSDIDMPLNRRLFVGDKVRLDRGSVYWGQSGDSEGTVTGFLLNGSYGRLKVPYDASTQDEHIYQVRWENGHSNSYRPVDITLVKSILPQQWQVKVIGAGKDEWNEHICKWRTTGCTYGPWTSNGYLNETGLHSGEVYSDRKVLSIVEFYTHVLGIPEVSAITMSKYSPPLAVGVDPFDLSGGPVISMREGEWICTTVAKSWCNVGDLDVVMKVFSDGSVITDRMMVEGYTDRRLHYHEYKIAEGKQISIGARKFVGRYIKCRKDAPNAGSAKMGDVGTIKGMNASGSFEVVGFSQSPYSASPDFVNKYELLPHTYSPSSTVEPPPSEDHDYRVGDWIIILESRKNMNDVMRRRIGDVVQISGIKRTRGGEHIEVMFNNDGAWAWGTEWGHFRKALPHEIPETDPNMIKYRALDPYIKNGSYYSRLAEQRYPKGTIIRRLHSNGKSDTDLITIDAATTVNTYMIRSGDVDAGANRSYLYVNGKWAEIVSSSQSAPLDLDHFAPPESWRVGVSSELKLSSKREKKKLLEEAITEVPEVSVKIISKTQTKTI